MTEGPRDSSRGPSHSQSRPIIAGGCYHVHRPHPRARQRIGGRRPKRPTAVGSSAPPIRRRRAPDRRCERRHGHPGRMREAHPAPAGDGPPPGEPAGLPLAMAPPRASAPDRSTAAPPWAGRLRLAGSGSPPPCAPGHQAPRSASARARGHDGSRSAYPRAARTGRLRSSAPAPLSRELASTHASSRPSDHPAAQIPGDSRCPPNRPATDRPPGGAPAWSSPARAYGSRADGRRCSPRDGNRSCGRGSRP